MKLKKMKNIYKRDTIVPKGERQGRIKGWIKWALMQVAVGALHGIAFLIAVIIALALLGPVCRMIQAF